MRELVFLLGLLLPAGLAAQADGSSGEEEAESAAGTAAPDEHVGPGHDVPLAPESFTREEQIRIDRLFSLVVCKCPTEKWSKSLSGCAEGCALEQKIQIRRRVKERWEDEKILEEQVRLYGPRALARTPAEGLPGFFVYVLPFLILIGFTAAVILLLRRFTRPAEAERAAAGATTQAPRLSAEDRAVDDDIERELAEMD